MVEECIVNSEAIESPVLVISFHFTLSRTFDLFLGSLSTQILRPLCLQLSNNHKFTPFTDPED